MFCANSQCQLSSLSPADARIEIKARLPENWENFKSTMFLKWKPNGEATFHQSCWSVVLKMARTRGTSRSRGSVRTEGKSTTPAMKQAEKLLVTQAAKTLEKFDSLEDIKKAAKLAAGLIRRSQHCIAFTGLHCDSGAGISTSAGLGDFRGKSGKWTEEDQSAMDPAILMEFQSDGPGTSSSISVPESHRAPSTELCQSESEVCVGRNKDPEDLLRLTAEGKNQNLEQSLSEANSKTRSGSATLLSPVSTKERRKRSNYSSEQDDLTHKGSTAGSESSCLQESILVPDASFMKNSTPPDQTTDCTGLDTTSLPCQEPPRKRRRSSSKDESGARVPVKEELPVMVENESAVNSEESVDYERLRPTYTHEALALLLERGLVHYIVSQNCDGLHLLSGVSPDCISELHGNVFVEKCSSCEKRYTRKYYVLHDGASQYYEEIEDYGETDLTKPRFAVQCDLCGLCHRTGRRCEEPKCKGFLEDTIINFRDNLEESALDQAMDESGMSDIILCLGTTLTVTPACDIVEGAKGEKPLIICNRQKTSKDRLARVRVFGDCDFFMAEVLTHLIGRKQVAQWEGQRNDRMKEYDAKRELAP